MTATTTTRPKTFSRWRASGIHLLISAIIAAATFFAMLRAWYPQPLFTAEGGKGILLILIWVDVVIGPLITLIIFKLGKPGLRFDLTVIALAQASALIYGIHVMYVARPVYIALVDNQFETVRANDLDPANLAQAPAAFQAAPITGPVFVAVELPMDMKVLNELISQAAKGGEIVSHLPRFYVPYSERRKEAAAKSRPLELLRKDDAVMAERIDKAIADTGRKVSELGFLPLQTRRGWGAVLLDAKTGNVVAILPPSS